MVNDILFYRQNLLKIAESRHLMSNTHQCIFIIARRRIFGKHPRLLFRTVLNRIKRATFRTRVHVVMREACTFRFDAASRFRITALKRKFFTSSCARSAQGATPHPYPQCRLRRHPRNDQNKTQGIRGHDTYFPAVREICIVSPHSVSSPRRPLNAASGGIKRQTPRQVGEALFRSERGELRTAGALRQFRSAEAVRREPNERRKSAAPTSPHAVFPYNSNPINEIKFFKKSKFSGHSA